MPAVPGAVITSSVTGHSRITGVEAGVPLPLYTKHSPYSDTLPRPHGYPGKMVYILTLTASEEAASHVKFLTERRLTKAFPKRVAQGWKASAPWIALILTYGGGEDVRYLKWMGTVSRTDTPGQLDYSVTIDPLVRCPQEIPIDGPGGLLVRLPVSLQEEFTTAVADNDVGNCGQPFWESFSQAVIDSQPKMAGLIDWLLAAGTPPDFDARDAADRSWQEQQDCAYCISRITGLPPLTFAAWRRPASRHAPYLAGLVPRPYEQSMIEHDARTVGVTSEMFDDWWPEDSARYDIHAITTSDGRRLEIINVNNISVEGRTGTDMVYYHEPTHSFTLVQYKRLDSQNKPMYADERFYDQLDRLGEVERLSKKPRKPSEWRLGRDSCFMKLAYWPEKESQNATRELAHGMYLPVSYIRMLLDDDSTRGVRKNSDARILGYRNVERHLVGRQFIELVTHGLVGTVGVSVEELRAFVRTRVAEGQSVMLGVESGTETGSARQKRVRRRGAVNRTYQHEVIKSQPAGPPDQAPGPTQSKSAPQLPLF